MKNDTYDSLGRPWENSMRMNSLTLQQEFPKAYEEFFHTHNIVLSANGVLSWGPDITHGVSVLHIKQKIPLKTFCGINLNTSGKVSFRSLFVYDIMSHVFGEKSFPEMFKYPLENLTTFLEDSLRNNGYMGGIEVDFLSEAPPGHGFAFASVFSVLLTFGVFVVSGKLTTRDFCDNQFSHEHSLFEDLYRYSLILFHHISKKNGICGGNQYAIMRDNTTTPILSLSSKDIRFSREDSHDSTVQRISLDYQTDKTLYKDLLENFLSIPPIPFGEVPLDYGILFTGLEYGYDDITLCRQHSNNEESTRRNLITDLIEALPILDNKKKILLDLLEFGENDTISANIDSFNLKILEAFSILLKDMKNGTSDDYAIEIFRQIGLSSFSYQKENRFFFHFEHYFHQFQQFHDEKIALLPFNSGKMGGNLLFILKKGYSRATFQKTVDQLRSDGEKIALYHSSWRDGYGSEGICLDQYLSGEQYSLYTKKGDIFYIDSHGLSYCGEYDTLIKKETDGVLLDTISGRIYVRGKKLTSQDIHSQNTTIDVLGLLLTHIGKEIPNSMLPHSTYSQNKNEILGKIIVPIKKIVKDSFGGELSLSCTGGITEYYLRLQKDEHIVIALIRKL